MVIGCLSKFVDTTVHFDWARNYALVHGSLSMWWLEILASCVLCMSARNMPFKFNSELFILLKIEFVFTRQTRIKWRVRMSQSQSQYCLSVLPTTINVQSKLFMGCGSICQKSSSHCMSEAKALNTIFVKKGLMSFVGLVGARCFLDVCFACAMCACSVFACHERTLADIIFALYSSIRLRIILAQTSPRTPNFAV